jgi:hypothetical protein
MFEAQKMIRVIPRSKNLLQETEIANENAWMWSTCPLCLPLFSLSGARMPRPDVNKATKTCFHLFSSGLESCNLG